MNVDDAAGTSSEARLDQGIVLHEVVLVDGPAEHIVRQELPTNRKTEDIIFIVVDEVLHLACTVGAVVLSQGRPGSARGATAVAVTAKIEARDVDTCELELSRRGGWRVRRT